MAVLGGGEREQLRGAAMIGMLAALDSLGTSPVPRVRVLEWSLAFDPRVPAWVLGALALAAVVCAFVVYGSRRVELGRRSRLVLGVLRALVLLAPVVVLSRPYLELQKERATPKSILFLVDASGSMTVRDSAGAAPVSRWEQEVHSVETCIAAIEANARARGGSPEETPSIGVAVFDRETRPVAPGDLASAGPRAADLPTWIASALGSTRERLAGAPSAAVVLLSDGADNGEGASPAVREQARALARAGVRVDTCLVGNPTPRDVALTAWAEAAYALGGEPVPIRVRLEHEGFGRAAVTVTVRHGEKTLATRDLTLPPDEKWTEVALDVQPEDSGRTRCRIETSPLPGELTATNNTAGVEVFLIDQPLEVLYVEKVPRWQYRFLVNAMRRDEKLEPTAVLLSEDAAAASGERAAAALPANVEELARFDAIVLGDVGPQDLPADLWRGIEDHVRAAGAGLVLIAGTEHNPRDLAAVLGASLPFERAEAPAEGEAAALRPMPAPLGLRHPLMRFGGAADARSAWEAQPPIEWMCPVQDVKAGALVLAEVAGAAGGAAQPLVLLQRVGRGTVVFVGTDETWKWRYQTGDKYFYGFWGRVLRHAAMPHRAAQRESVRITLPEGRIAAGAVVPVTVAMEDATARGGTEARPDGSLVLVAERVAAENVPAPAPLRWTLERGQDLSVWQGRIRFPSAGTYRLAIEGVAPAGSRELEVAPSDAARAEASDPAVRPALLEEIAALTGGTCVPAGQSAQLFAERDLSPIRERWSERVTLWDGGVLLALVALLLTIEWVVRKWRYLP